MLEKIRALTAQNISRGRQTFARFLTYILESKGDSQVSDQGLMSQEATIDAKLQKLRTKLADNSASAAEQEEYQALSKRRVDLMESPFFNRVEKFQVLKRRRA